MNIFGLNLKIANFNEVIEYIQKYDKSHKNGIHIVSLNPEIMVSISEQPIAKEAFRSANIGIVDGIGMYILMRLKGLSKIQRLTGIELMENLLEESEKEGWKVLFIGGKANLSEKVLYCQQKKYPKIKAKAMEGVKNIRNSDNSHEEAEIWKVLNDFKPKIVFVSYGSPYQEMWIEKNRNHFQGMVVTGVGGAFDMFVGTLPRAPKLIRKIGMEWFWRLLLQPSRWKRQLKLLKFVYLAIKDILSGKKDEVF